MDKQTDTILRAILRCAIATENHRTSKILERMPYAILPDTGKPLSSSQFADVVSESKYNYTTDTFGEFQSVRHALSFKTLNYFFFKESSLAIKQSYKYFNLPGSRAHTAYRDREAKKYHLFDEIYGLIETGMYSIAHQRYSLNFDANKLNEDINKGIESRNPHAQKNIDFKPLLNIIYNELQDLDKNIGIKQFNDIADTGRNTFLNYLNTFTLAEYYVYRKTINDHFLNNCDRPLYKSPEAQYYLLQEAVDTQIYPKDCDGKGYGEINKGIFRDITKENIVEDSLDHNKAKDIINDIIHNSPEVIDELPALLTHLMQSNNSNRKVGVDKVIIVPVKNDNVKYKTPRFKYSLSLVEDPIKLKKSLYSYSVETYIKEKQKRDEQERLIAEAKNSTQLTLF